jgi:flagellar biogenesis protein FliO
MRFFSFLTLAASLLLFSENLFGYSLSGVSVTGEKEALIRFESAEEASVPTLKIIDNVVELTFNGARLEDSQREKQNLSSPHPLVQRVGIYSPDRNTVKGRVVLNGSLENLKNRMTVAKVPGGVTLSIAYPAGENAALNLLKEEQLPIAASLTSTKTAEAHSNRAQMIVLVLVLAIFAASGFFFVRFLKKQGVGKGSRKFLVEQMSYCAVGPKAGVSLLKVGNEFVLVGVTSSQVTLISQLPKLQMQYEEDSRFERGVFKEAVEEEYSRVKRGTPLSS